MSNEDIFTWTLHSSVAVKSEATTAEAFQSSNILRYASGYYGYLVVTFNFEWKSGKIKKFEKKPILNSNIRDTAVNNMRAVTYTKISAFLVKSFFFLSKDLK